MNLKTYLMIKRAVSEADVDAFMNHPGWDVATDMIDPTLNLIDAAYKGRAALKGARTADKDIRGYLKELRYSPNYVGPYTQNYRLLKKRRLIENILAKGNKPNKTLSELLGSTLNTTALTAAGAGTGYWLGRKKPRKDKLKYTLIGGVSGLGTGAVLNGLGTTIGEGSKKRNRKELTDYYNSGYDTVLKNYVIPGVGNYNAAKNNIGADLLLENYMMNPKVRKRIDQMAYGDAGYIDPDDDDFLYDGEPEEPKTSTKNKKNKKDE